MSFKVEDLQEAILQEKVDGWLFSNYRRRDTLSEKILNTPTNLPNTRPWFYAVPGQGTPIKIVQVMEQVNLDSLPGDKLVYVGREDLFAALKTLAGKSWGVHISENIPSISYMDAGTAAILTSAGLSLVSAGALIQRFKGLLDSLAIESHNRATDKLYDLMEETWKFTEQSFRTGETIYEGTLKRAMLDGMKNRGLVTHLPPQVAAGIHSSDPHFGFSGQGSAIEPGSVIQFDLWAREDKENSIYADISIVGIYGKNASPEVEKAFADLIDVREKTISFIKNELSAGRRPSGSLIDKKTIEILQSKGYANAIKHRTGHGIDTECHGSGVNIDSIEFPDTRLLIDGSCFSLEPGIYFDNYGLRTEINMYISEGKAIVSGADRRQFTLWHC